MGDALYGLIEAGGTKFVLGIARGKDDIIATTRLPTLNPTDTLGAVVEWFSLQVQIHGPLTAIGIGSFGPLELDPASPDWGHITRTPKPGWANIDLVGPLRRAFNCPVAIDTDVNGAALAEYRWGAGQGQRVAVYLTIGTGIGGGVMVDGKLLHGLSHPEMGHMRLPRHPLDTNFEGICPYHGDCLEGVASGPAIKARWEKSLSELPADHPAHDIIAWYLAQIVSTLQAIFEPGRIIFGGGVMGTPGMIDRVKNCATSLGKDYYVGAPADIITLPALGDRAGLLGALALAENLTV